MVELSFELVGASCSFPKKVGGAGPSSVGGSELKIEASGLIKLTLMK